MSETHHDDSIEKGMRAAFAAAASPMSSVLRILQGKVNARLGVQLPDARDGQHDSILKVNAESKSLRDVAGRYQVLGEIGRGGVGVVFKGHDVDLGRDVALKVLHEKFAEQPEILARFVEEAQIGGQLQHPGIVPVYELGLQNGERPFFAMKLVKGETLAEQLIRRKDPSGDRRRLLGIFEQVCHTVAYAHARRVVHRDLKPANVMIGAFGEVQVVDWGFAKVLPKLGELDRPGAPRAADASQLSVISTARSASGSSSHSVAGSMMGTPAYMPPEQALGDVEHMDQQSDVFGLGGILCEILTGRAVYLGEDGDLVQQAARADVSGAHARVEKSGADANLISLCKQCLSPARQARPTSASEVALQVGAYLTSVEERAREAQIHAAEARLKARSTVMLAAAALVIVVLGGGGYFTIERAAAIRREHASQRVAEAMNEASGLLGQARAAGSTELAAWDHAVSAAQQAGLLAAADDVDAEQRSRAEEQLAGARNERTLARQAAARHARDLAMLERLVEVRIPSDDDVRHEGWPVRDARRLDTDYATCFASYLGGRDLLAIDLDDAVTSLQQGGIQIDLAAGLDQWAGARQFLRSEPDAPSATATAMLRQLAQRIDSTSNWRNELRALLAKPQPDRGALEAMTHSVEFDALPATSVTLLGEALWSAGAVDSALEVYRRGQSIHPADFGLSFRLGVLFELLRDPRTKAAVACYRIALALRPEMREVSHRLGIVLEANGDLPEAFELFHRLNAADPDNGHWVRHLGNVLLDQGHDDQAIATYRQAIALDPNDGMAYGNIGSIRQSQGRLEEAIESLVRAVELDPKLFAAYYTLGEVQQRQGHLEQAIASLKTAIDLDPKDADAWVGLGSVQEMQRHPEEAVKSYDKAIELDSKNAQAHAGRGSALQDQGLLDEAIESFKTAIALDPKLRDVHYFLGFALQGEDRQLEAIESWSAEFALNRKNAKPLVNIGIAQQALGHMEEAMENWAHAIEVDSSIAEAHVDLGVALRRAGHLEQALASWRNALNILARQSDPDSVEKRRMIELWITNNTDESIVARQEELLAIERGESDGTSPQDWIEAAVIGYQRRDFADSLRTYERAFAAYPGLETEFPHRYNAACAAALAGSGRSETVPQVSDAERATLRGKAFAWSRAELERWRAEIAAGDDRRDGAVLHLEECLQDRDFEGVRSDHALKLLPADEAQEWRSYWKDVAELIAKGKQAR